jgi:uncharacterized protein (TIGR03067 family)
MSTELPYPLFPEEKTMSKYEQDSLSESVVKAMQGDFRVVYSELNGEMTPVQEFSNIVVTHRGNNFIVKKNDKVVHEGTFTINVAVMPHQIVLRYSKSVFEGNLGGPRVGIAQLVGDTLRTNLPGVGYPPPSDFITYPDSDLVLAVHQRVGSEKGRGLTTSKTASVAVW